MFNNNINKPAITVFLPLTSAKTSFCQWQKLFLPGRFFRRKKTVYTGHWQKLANPGIAVHILNYSTHTHTDLHSNNKWVYYAVHDIRTDLAQTEIERHQ